MAHILFPPRLAPFPCAPLLSLMPAVTSPVTGDLSTETQVRLGGQRQTHSCATASAHGRIFPMWQPHRVGPVWWQGPSALKSSGSQSCWTFPSFSQSGMGVGCTGMWVPCGLGKDSGSGDGLEMWVDRKVTITPDEVMASETQDDFLGQEPTFQKALSPICPPGPAGYFSSFI